MTKIFWVTVNFSLFHTVCGLLSFFFPWNQLQYFFATCFHFSVKPMSVLLLPQCFKSWHDNFSSKWAIFQTHFSWLLVDPTFLYSYGGNRGHILSLIRIYIFGVKQELRKVRLKLTLTNKIIWRKIVVSRLETLYTFPKLKNLNFAS